MLCAELGACIDVETSSGAIDVSDIVSHQLHDVGYHWLT